MCFFLPRMNGYKTNLKIIFKLFLICGPLNKTLIIISYIEIEFYLHPEKIPKDQ